MSIENNKIYNEDCLITMAKMPDEYVDLTITSPPYDNLRDYKGYTFNFEDVAKELYRVTKKGGVVVWIVGDSIINGSESCTSFKQALYFKESCGFNLHDTMIYQKAGLRFPEKKRYAQIFEYMFVFSKGTPTKTHIIKDRVNKWAGWTNWGRNAVRVKDGQMKKTEDAKRYAKYGSRFNIWRYSNAFGFGTKDKAAYQHSATFPEKMVEDHIISWSDEGDVVYDPLIGSGTTAKMAILLNRTYIGSEVSKEYTDNAIERISAIESKRGIRIQELSNEASLRLMENESLKEEISKKENGVEQKKWQPNLPNKLNTTAL